MVPSCSNMLAVQSLNKQRMEEQSLSARMNSMEKEAAFGSLESEASTISPLKRKESKWVQFIEDVGESTSPMHAERSKEAVVEMNRKKPKNSKWETFL